MMKSTKQCRDMIKLYEGFRDTTYLCSAGKKTIGYGCIVHSESDKNIVIILIDGSKQEYKKPLSKSDFDDMFNKNLDTLDSKVREALGKDVKQSHFDAMVSLGFNIGISAISHSTALRELKLGNFEKSRNAIGLWNKATVNGKKVEIKGLTNRRKKEQLMFDGIYNA